MNIGFIGLGIMGRPMAGHLIAAGHQVATVSHRSPPPSELLQEGLVVCASGREVAERSDVVILMVPDTPDVEREPRRAFRDERALKIADHAAPVARAMSARVPRSWA